ncbi:hypothetical protein P170DRAFT_254453 [Aspergillus steynii IBT 23096]|uniref:Uncharacterized protein n=1 Tax=Aspergillus steynii IBT 23096 TaxID=1392250 RepID=A0A2I2FZA1_9EURO|nr:uncharacterized protein P170DRAFT_254453 [Aspergillus steynii IBT 23096]PLB45886.1 hypothetical protein P170DRAFT_254453 [Aspergillus steynii IBT 23096]
MMFIPPFFSHSRKAIFYWPFGLIDLFLAFSSCVLIPLFSNFLLVFSRREWISRWLVRSHSGFYTLLY